MEKVEHYLDNSATTPVLPEAAGKAVALMTHRYGNPSSLHSKGFEAKRELEAAREAVACRLGAKPEEIIFSSGGTEANNLALLARPWPESGWGIRLSPRRWNTTRC